MMGASGSSVSAPKRRVFITFNPVKDAVTRFPASIYSTAVTAFIFFMSFFAFVESVAGYAVVPLSPYFTITPISTALYQYGTSPELSLFAGLMMSLLNFHFQFSSRRTELLLSMAISSASAFFILMEIVSGSPFSSGLTAYIVIPAYLSLLPSTQLSISPSARGSTGTFVQEEVEPYPAKTDFPRPASVSYDMAVFKKLRILDTSEGPDRFRADAEDRVKRIEKEIQEFETVASELEKRPAAWEKPAALPGPGPEAANRRIIADRPLAIAEEELADCSVCGSRTPAKEKNCVHCGISREKYAKRHP